MKKLLVISIVFLFFGMIIFPSTGIQIQNKTFIQTSRGNTLYVGGNGSGNYTKIQDAVDNASNGDTVFVYDDSSPYYENLIINTSINLVGEDKHSTTVIYNASGVIIYTYKTCVNISGFLLINGLGIRAQDSNYIKISDNIFLNCRRGVDLDYSYESYVISNSFINCYEPIRCYQRYSVTTISNNFINSSTEEGDHQIGDIICHGKNFVITNNSLIRDINGTWEIGLVLDNVSNSIIQNNKFKGYYDSGNTFLYSGTAILFLHENHNNIISNNNITNNYKGISFVGFSYSNQITNNNFINNNRDTKFALFLINNLWDCNYWDTWIGFKYKSPIFQRFPHLIRGGLLSFAIDWHPASEPYNI